MRAQASLALKHSHHRAGSAGKDLSERTRGPTSIAAETFIACHQIRPAQVEAQVMGRFICHRTLRREGTLVRPMAAVSDGRAVVIGASVGDLLARMLALP